MWETLKMIHIYVNFMSINLYESVHIYSLILWHVFYTSHLPWINHIHMICSFVNFIVEHNSRILWSNLNEKCFWSCFPSSPTTTRYQECFQLQIAKIFFPMSYVMFFFYISLFPSFLFLLSPSLPPFFTSSLPSFLPSFLHLNKQEMWR